MNVTNPSFTSVKPDPHWARLPLFDRKGSRRVRFGDVVENVNERVESSTAEEEIYVGLDDLDSGSLHIRRWGKGSDVIGTKLRFRKGDIIFGRRRAYQRKLAVAEVDGICSAHAMVVRAKPAVVLPEFLPFLMMSDRFMKRAVEIGKLLWHALGAKAVELIDQNVHLESVRDDVETLVLDAQVSDEILKDADPGKRAREIEIKLIARLKRHLGNPKFTELGERLEKIKERHEQGFLNSLEFPALPA